jgi:hypothetical protein
VFPFVSPTYYCNKKAPSYELLQSKNGGLPGWEPAAGSSWLEVNASTF